MNGRAMPPVPLSRQLGKRLDSLPGQMDITAGIDLEQLCAVDVAHLDERRRDEQQVRRVKGDTVWPPLPLDRLTVSVRFPMPVHIHTKG